MTGSDSFLSASPGAPSPRPTLPASPAPRPPRIGASPTAPAAARFTTTTAAPPTAAAGGPANGRTAAPAAFTADHVPVPAGHTAVPTADGRTSVTAPPAANNLTDHHPTTPATADGVLAAIPVGTPPGNPTGTPAATPPHASATVPAKEPTPEVTTGGPATAPTPGPPETARYTAPTSPATHAPTNAPAQRPPANAPVPSAPATTPADTTAPVPIDTHLERVRSRLTRLSPEQAQEAARHGALLVDIRYAALRDRDGLIPGALVVERNELEWRLDPQGTHRLSEADCHDRQIVVICNEGYASSLAAASLRDLGLHRATDLVGGFQAWRAAGLAVTAPASP